MKALSASTVASGPGWIRKLRPASAAASVPPAAGVLEEPPQAASRAAATRPRQSGGSGHAHGWCRLLWCAATDGHVQTSSPLSQQIQGVSAMVNRSQALAVPAAMAVRAPCGRRVDHPQTACCGAPGRGVCISAESGARLGSTSVCTATGPSWRIMCAFTGRFVLGDALAGDRSVAPGRCRVWPLACGPALRDWLRGEGHHPQTVMFPGKN